MSLDPTLFRSSLEIRILQLLSTITELPDDGCRVVTTFGNRSVTVTISATGAGIPIARQAERTECELDCLGILQNALKPMTRVEIRSALEASDKLWGESTVAQALATMVAEGVLENSRKRGGYYVPET